jgi:hypothetical protein
MSMLMLMSRNCIFSGGTLGLFAGMSLVSGVEILIWLFRIIQNLIFGERRKEIFKTNTKTGELFFCNSKERRGSS